MPDQSSESTTTNRPPWPADRWTRRIEGLDRILEETIIQARKQIDERNAAINQILEKTIDSAKEDLKAFNASSNSDPAVIRQLNQTITTAKKLLEERQATAETQAKTNDSASTRVIENASDGASDYYLLPEAYQESNLSSLFRTDSEFTRLKIGLGMLLNMRAFLTETKTELQELFEKEPNGVFSDNYIYSQLLTQISTDINIVQQALRQRQLDPANNRMTHQGYVLQIGGDLANAVLKRVKSCGLLPEHVVPLSYLQDRIDIRLIPYYDVVLLSLPYGALNSTCDWLSTDFLAIPHEVGHYLFWWGSNEEQNIRETLEKSTAAEPMWVKTWLEELFADVFSCLIAGPVSVIGFQELMTSSSPDMLQRHFHDDHAHPFPSLRPFIQSAILRKMNHFDQAADALDANWNNWVTENWPGLDNPLQHIYAVGEGELLRGSQIVAYLSRPGGTLDSILKALTPLHPKNPGDCWTGNQPLAEMYDAFTSGGFLKTVSADTAVPTAKSIGQISAIPAEDSDSATMRADRMKESRIGDRDSQIREFFSGWSTEGPKRGDGGI